MELTTNDTRSRRRDRVLREGRESLFDKGEFFTGS